MVWYPTQQGKVPSFDRWKPLRLSLLVGSTRSRLRLRVLHHLSASPFQFQNASLPFRQQRFKGSGTKSAAIPGWDRRAIFLGISRTVFVVSILRSPKWSDGVKVELHVPGLPGRI